MDTRASPAELKSDVVRLVLLHAPRIVLPGGADQALSPKDAALLAILALDGPTPRARIAALLWPDADDERARNSLRQRLFRMRKLAGRDVIEQSAVVALAPRVLHDLGDPDSALYADAAAWPGDLLGAHRYDAEGTELAAWVDGARQRFRGLRRDALGRIAAGLEESNHIAAALPYAERLARDEPLLEHAQRRLMRLHYRRGDRGAALHVYERLKLALDADLGETPSRETQELAALVEAAIALPVAPPAAPVVLLRPPRLVGREREWALLQAGWEQRLQVPAVLRVRGEPGIGKSRLLGDFCAAQGLAAPVRGRPGDANVPYALLARLLRTLWADDAASVALDAWARAELARVLPELGVAAAVPLQPLQPLRLQQAVEQALAAVAPPGLALDDLHFADTATLELLPTLLAAAPQTCWLLAWRAAEAPVALKAGLHGDDALGGEALDLEALDEPAVQTLLRSLVIPGLDAAAWGPRLHRHTGGNPLFILETLSAVLLGAEGLRLPGRNLPLPHNLGELITRRFRLLSPAALKLLRLAALAGQDTSVELVAQVLGTDPLGLADAWNELEQTQMLNRAGFTHDLIQEACLRDVPGAIAQALHVRIAQHLADAQAPAARVALHWEQAGHWPEAARAYLQAADAAHALARLADEARLLERAAHAQTAAGDHSACLRTLERTLETLIYVDVSQVEPLARRLLASAVEPAQRLHALAAAMQAFNHVADYDASVALLPEAMTLAARLNEADMAAELAVLGGHSLVMTGRPDEAMQLMDAQRAWIDNTAGAERRREFNADHATMLLKLDRPLDAEPLQRQAIAEASALGRWEQVRVLLVSHAQSLAQLGRHAEAAQSCRQALALGERIGIDDNAPAFDAFTLACVLRDLGHYAEAIDRFAACLEAFTRLGAPAWVATCRSHAAQLWLQLGQPARGQALLTPIDPALPAFLIAHRRLVEAGLAARTEPHAARVLIDQALAALGPRGRASLRLVAALLAAQTQPDAAALQTCRAAGAEAQQRGLRGVWVAANAVLGGVAGQAGTLDEALAASTAALGALADGSTPEWFTPAELAGLCLRAFERCGRPAQANQAARLGARWLREVALPQLPAALHAGFLERHELHREVLAAAAAFGGHQERA
jgi:DNA-binding SARP family transcriptional activator/tetratricopeptide (TPR) repeat protein